MIDTKFTPGPWLVKDGFSGEFEVYARTVDNFGYYEIAEIKDLDEETLPNARLIAAAPDLYAALRSLSTGEGLPPGTTIEGLLAKARGES